MAERTVVTLGETLAALVEGKKYATLRDILVTMNAVDVAGIFEEMPEEKLPLLFRLLPKELAAETFVEMEPEAQEDVYKRQRRRCAAAASENTVL